MDFEPAGPRYFGQLAVVGNHNDDFAGLLHHNSALAK